MEEIQLKRKETIEKIIEKIYKHYNQNGSSNQANTLFNMKQEFKIQHVY